MKITSVSSNYGCKPQRPHFTGDSRPFFVNVHENSNIEKELEAEHFRTAGLQCIRRGEAPVKKLEGTYPPDVMVTGTIYYADNQEPVGDWAFGTHSYVIANRNYMQNLTIDRVLDNEKDSPTIVEGQRYCLWHDVRFNKQKLASMNIPFEPIDKADDKILKEEGEEALHQTIKDAKEGATTPEEKAIARYRETREMRRIVERTHLEMLDEMERLNIDYYGENKHPMPLIKVPNEEP